MVERLSVHRFRNLPDLTWEVGSGCHLVVGPNGAGKTSLLEAVYLAATARSFRTSQLEDCVRREDVLPAPARAPASDQRRAAPECTARGRSRWPPLH